MLNQRSRSNLNAKLIQISALTWSTSSCVWPTIRKDRRTWKGEKNLVLQRTKRKETELHTWTLCDRRENVSWKFLAKSIELYYYSWRCYFIVVYGTYFLKNLSLQEANKSQEYSDSCIFNNNYPSVGIGTGVSVLPKKKKTVKNHIKTVMMRLVLYSSYEGLPW